MKKILRGLYLNLLNYEADSKGINNNEMLARLNLKEGMSVADLGSGGGYFTTKFAKAVGKRGTVYAVDIDKINLEFVVNKAKKEGYTNIKTINACIDSPSILANSVDVIFARNMFHHVKNPASYFAKCRDALKTGGHIVIVEHKKPENEKFSHVKIFKHFTDEQIIIDSMKKAGYQRSRSEEIQKEYSFNFFIA